MTELPDEIHDRILRLGAQGDELASASQFEEALSKYNEAWELLPESKADWGAANWLLAAIGDAAFQSGYFESAREALEYAVYHAGGLGNPFLHLRLGQVLYEKGELDRSADELMRAYMSEGEEIFASDDPKYRAFLATRANLDNR